ncbi:MAG: V-type ATP synthase subunit F [Candidatus Hydrothermarchaeaceae archaeon]
MKIGVVGDFDTVTGFRLAGVREAHEVEEPREGVKILKKLMKEDVGLIIITERLADQIRDETSMLMEGKTFPLIVEIPDKRGPIEGKVDPIMALIKKAVGVDIKF